MRGMAREYAAGNSLGPGWRESAGIFGCPVGGSPTVPSGREWNGSQPGQGAAELLSPRPAIRKMQGQPACRAGEPSGQGEEPPPEGLGGGYPLSQTDPRRPAGQVVGHRLDGQPGAVGGEAARGEMVQPDAVLEVAYGILDLGVAAMVSLQFEQLPVPVGDEAVIAVFGEEGQLGTGRRLHPPDDEPYRRGVCLGLEGGAELVSEVQDYNDIRIMGAIEDRIMLSTSNLPQMDAVLITTFVLPNTSETGSAGGLGHIGGTVHPVRNRRPGIFGYRLDEIVQADGDGVADIDPAADGDHGVGIEAAVGTHGELPAGPAVANPAHRFAAAPRAVLARPSRSRANSTSPVPAATANSG